MESFDGLFQIDILESQISRLDAEKELFLAFQDLLSHITDSKAPDSDLENRARTKGNGTQTLW